MALATKSPENTRPSSSVHTTAQFTDPKSILKDLINDGITVKNPTDVTLFTAATELEHGSISTSEFVKLALPLVSTIFGSNTDVVDATAAATALGKLADKIHKNSEQAKTQAAADVLRQRYLGVFETAKGLESESLHIVTAVKEVLEDSLDDHELAHLQADTASIIDFLREETLPFLKEVERRGVGNVSIDLIRCKRSELKQKIEVQRRNVNFHLQRVERGIDTLTDGTYYIKTNHLPRYAAATAMEILLRGYYILLGRLDKDDIMVDSDAQNLTLLAKERVEVVRSLLEQYKNRRENLITTKALYEDEVLTRVFRYWVNDAGSPNDILCPRLNLNDLDSLLVTPKDVAIVILEDGTLRYTDKSVMRTHDHNKTIACGQALAGSARLDIRTLLRHEGLVWRAYFQPHVDRMEMILNGILGPQHTAEDPRLTSKELAKWPKTIPLSRFQPDQCDDSAPSFLSADGTRLFWMVHHIAGRKTVGECAGKSGWAAYAKDIYKGLTSISIDESRYWRCEVLLEMSNCEWVCVADGNPPARVVNLGENEDQLPFLIGRIFYDVNDEKKHLANAADILSQWKEGDLSTLTWPRAAYCGVTKAELCDKYEVLCYKEEHLIEAMAELKIEATPKQAVEVN